MPDLVQLRNPKTDRWVKIDREKGRILGQKRTKGPWKGVPVAEKLEDTDDSDRRSQAAYESRLKGGEKNEQGQ